MASLINMEFFSDVEAWFQVVAVVLLSPAKNKYVDKYLDALLKLKDNNSLIDFDINFRECNDVNDETEEKPSSGLHKTSVFYVHFKNLLDTVNKNYEFSSFEGSTNEYYSEKFLNLLVLKYIPFCPLWTGIILRKRSTERHNNSYVEIFFGHLKNNVLGGYKNFKCSRYLRKSREHVQALYKEFICGISKSRLTKQRQIRQNDDPLSEHVAQETWNKKNAVHRVLTFLEVS